MEMMRMSHRKDESNPSPGATERILTLRMRIDDGGRPAGTLGDGTADPTSTVAFVGWLALIAELSNALGTQTDAKRTSDVTSRQTELAIDRADPERLA